jgi:hypothetical protein
VIERDRWGEDCAVVVVDVIVVVFVVVDVLVLGPASPESTTKTTHDHVYENAMGVDYSAGSPLKASWARVLVLGWVAARSNHVRARLMSPNLA